MEDVTAVLISREEKYPEIVLERLTCTEFFQDILIITECESIYHRYLAAAKANTKHVFVLDDDALINFQILWTHYNKVQITNAMPKEFVEKYTGSGCTLVGWGCYFPKSMLAVFDKYIEKYGTDEHLLREADRIFTFLNKPFNTIIMPHEDLSQTEDRMCYQENHYRSMHEALEKCKTLL